MRIGLTGAVAMALAATMSGCAAALPAGAPSASRKPADIVAEMDVTSVLPTADEVKHLLGDAWTVSKPVTHNHDRPAASPTPTAIGSAKTAGTCQSLTADYEKAWSQGNGLQHDGGLSASGPQNAGGQSGGQAHWAIFTYWDPAAAQSAVELYQKMDTACSAGGPGVAPSYPSQISGGLGRHVAKASRTDNCTVVARANLMLEACSDNPNAEREADAMAKIVLDKLAAAGVS